MVCGSFWVDFFIKLDHKCFDTTGKHNLAVCGSFCWEKHFLLIFVPFYCFVLIGLFTTNPNFPLDLPLFYLVEKKKLFKYFWASFWESHFLIKRDVFSEFPRKNFKTTGKHILAVCGSFCWGKHFLLIFVPFCWFDQKKLFKQIQIFLRICPFSNLLRKTNFLSISVQVSEMSFFFIKREVFSEFHRKCFKKKGKHCLAVYGSIWGEKHFLLIFVPFYWFDQNRCQILIFHLVCPYSNLLKKQTNFLSISVLFSEIVTFWTKKRSSLWISPKMLHNNRGA